MFLGAITGRNLLQACCRCIHLGFTSLRVMYYDITFFITICSCFGPESLVVELFKVVFEKLLADKTPRCSIEGKVKCQLKFSVRNASATS
jgi:hypothetical protein